MGTTPRPDDVADVIPLVRPARWDWVPRTKLFRPPTVAETVLDPDLLDRTARAVDDVPVTMIVATAGAGKSTLASAVVERTGRRAAWLRFDELDDDPASVVELLVRALDPLVEGGCAGSRQLLDTGLPAAADPRRAVGVLVNDLVVAGPPPLLLVLDDLHTVGDAGPVLDYLVANLPPALHLLITARRDPPVPAARLRARGQLHEVRDADLRISPERAAILLNDHLGLGLSPERVREVVATADGWVTGVRLLGTSPEALDDYLDSEILGDETPDLRRFLLDTAVLDVLEPDVCAAVTGRDDATSLLAAARARLGPLVLVADDRGRRPVLRHHDLLRAALRRRLAVEDPTRVPALHRAAAGGGRRPGRPGGAPAGRGGRRGGRRRRRRARRRRLPPPGRAAPPRDVDPPPAARRGHRPAPPRGARGVRRRAARPARRGDGPARARPRGRRRRHRAGRPGDALARRPRAARRHLRPRAPGAGPGRPRGRPGVRRPLPRRPRRAPPLPGLRRDVHRRPLGGVRADPGGRRPGGGVRRRRRDGGPRAAPQPAADRPRGRHGPRRGARRPHHGAPTGHRTQPSRPAGPAPAACLRRPARGTVGRGARGRRGGGGSARTSRRAALPARHARLGRRRRRPCAGRPRAHRGPLPTRGRHRPGSRAPAGAPGAARPHPAPPRPDHRARRARARGARPRPALRGRGGLGPGAGTRWRRATRRRPWST